MIKNLVEGGPSLRSSIVGEYSKYILGLGKLWKLNHFMMAWISWCLECQAHFIWKYWRDDISKSVQDDLIYYTLILFGLFYMYLV